MSETSAKRSARIRNGRIAMIASFSWWILTIGGIIFMINTGG